MLTVQVLSLYYNTIDRIEIYIIYLTLTCSAGIILYKSIYIIYYEYYVFNNNNTNIGFGLFNLNIQE